MAYSGAQLTRLGLSGIPRGLYGSFAGKAESTSGPHNPGRITRLGLAGITRGLYGDFSGKAEAIPEPEPEPEVPEPPAAGGGEAGRRLPPYTGRGAFPAQKPERQQAPVEAQPQAPLAGESLRDLLPRDSDPAQARRDAERERLAAEQARLELERLEAQRAEDNARLLAFLEAEEAAAFQAREDEALTLLMLDDELRRRIVMAALQKILVD